MHKKCEAAVKKFPLKSMNYQKASSTINIMLTRKSTNVLYTMHMRATYRPSNWINKMTRVALVQLTLHGWSHGFSPASCR